AVCRSLFFLLDGVVRSYYIVGDKEINLRLLADHSAVAAYSSLITGLPSEEFVECLTDCYGYLIPFDPLVEWEAVRRVLAERHYMSMELRLLMIQHKTARQRYREFMKAVDPRIVRDTPARHVASYLGITPECLSRIKRQT